MNTFRQELQQQLQERQEKALNRQRRTLSSPQGTELVVDGRKVLNFCSNDYLGLANHPDVVQAFKKGLDDYGAGSGASHLVCGHGGPHHELEQELAAFTGRSRALVFSSGYMANVGVLTTLLEKGDAVLEDRLNHASLLDGGLFCGAMFKRYPHLDTGVLNDLLQQSSRRKRRMVVSDGVFSMDGDTAPLPDLIAACENNDSLLMIDDAHGFGVLGKNGGGITASWQEQGHDIHEDNLHILVGTFGKAFGTGGAFVAGSEELVETLIQFCRPYIYTTAMPPAMAEATRCSLQIIQQEHWRREHLASLIERFREKCHELELTLLPSRTPIQAVVLEDVEMTLQASNFLLDRGIYVTAIRPPTVPVNTARLRITFSAAHTEKQLDNLLDALGDIAELAKR